MPRFRKRVLIQAFFLCCASFLFLFSLSLNAGTLVSSSEYSARGPELRVTVIDVGQGDAIHIRTPGGMDVLLDGGSNPYTLETGEYVWAKEAIDYLRLQGIRGLDAVIMSHPHPDHVRGIATVLSEMPVKRVYSSGYGIDGPAHNDCMRIIGEKKIAHISLRAGGIIEWEPQLNVEIMGPPPHFNFDDANNNSLIIRMAYGKTAFLFAGDAETEELDWVAERFGERLKADIMVLPHHGSYTSVNGSFINSVSPDAGIISCGKDNPFGHPHSKTMSFYRKKGVRLFRTDINGSVTVTSDGSSCKIEPERKRKAPGKRPGRPVGTAEQMRQKTH